MSGSAPVVEGEDSRSANGGPAVKETLEAARSYVRRGFCVVPIPRGEKGPKLQGWQNLRITEEQLPTYFDGTPHNLGVLQGEPSGWLVNIDLDVPEAAKLAPVFLPHTDRTYGRPGNPSSHHEYVAVGAVTKKFEAPPGPDSKRQTLVELLSTGRQAVMPPSVHPSGEVYTWEEDGEPARVDARDLSARCARLAAAVLLARSWPAEGLRDETALALSGALTRAGWTEQEVSDFVRAVAKVAGDEEWRRRDKAEAAADRLTAGRELYGWPRLAELVGAALVKRVREWLDLEGDDGEPTLSLAEVIAGLDEKAKEKPDSEGWRAFWRPLVYRAHLPAGDVNAILDHLVALGVGNKRPLGQEWKDYLWQREAQAAAERAKKHLTKVAGDRPVITYDPLDFNNLLPAVEKAMLTGSELLRVDKAYVSVLEDVLPGSRNVQKDLPPPKQVSLVPMTMNHMRLRVERDVCLVTVGEDGLEHPAPVPRDLASMLLDYLHKEAPAVTGLVQHPILLPTGRLIVNDGFDMETGLYVAKGDWDFRNVSENPSPDEAWGAAEYVREVLLGEVMLKDRRTDGTAVLAALLAGMSRKATEKGPSVLISAACQGTGKTTLAQMVHVLLTGRDMPVQPMVKDSTEFEKQMLSTLMRSPPMVCFDNVPDGATLDSDLIGGLAAVMTSPVYEARLLGHTLLVSAPTNVLWVFTGNSVTVGADYVRRFIQVDLLATEVRPEQHRYVHADPVQYSKGVRSNIIPALLTVQRAWFAAGCPEGGRSFGMGRDFDSLVTWPLEHAGQEGLFDKLEVTREVSPEIQAKRALVLAFYNCYGSLERRVADVLRDVATDDEYGARELSPEHAALRDAIEGGERRRLYNSQALGRFLGTLVDVRVEDPDKSLVLTMRRRAGGGSVYWHVEATLTNLS